MPVISSIASASAKALGLNSGSSGPFGSQLYTGSTAGGTIVNGQKVFTFTVPAGVRKISVLCIGGGGPTNASGTGCAGGGGGALAYVNNYSVTPGQTFTVYVAQSATTSGYVRTSSFGGTVCAAGGGSSASSTLAGAGGTVLYGTGYAGGAGGTGIDAGSFNSKMGGGGGAGGYTGVGGAGGTNVGAGSSGSGGAGGGGGSGQPSYRGGGGGGVGVNGLGDSGAGGNPGDTPGVGSFYIGRRGHGGSGGAPVYTTDITGSGTNSSVIGTGGNYGGGAGGGTGAGDSWAGGEGAVRIVWPGNVRQFPSSNVGA